MDIESVTVLPSKKRLVYIVDDEASVRRALERLLRSTGYETKAFASAQIFLHTADLSLGICAIVDVVMPGMSGFALQKRLRQDNIGIPVILVTASDDDVLQQQARATGAAAFFRKPVDGRALVDTIDRLRATET